MCFTCKSRFCHGCGKKYTDEWAEKQQERILNVPHLKGTPDPVLFALPAKAAFVMDAGKNIRMNGQKSSRNVS
ncbi:transposase zinc-binding domain-containing protein [Paenibacillus sp. IHB B 3415]|uniref:transposase zinc-binding domain-containing protein n=1 Tax=Paenibacillus sp. IHB B 3415 TaxID=867080 RepID=UPI0035A15AB4